jgi:hypothetical protein
MMAIAWQEIKPKEPEKPPVFAVTGHNSRIELAPLETLWRETPRRTNRI